MVWCAVTKLNQNGHGGGKSCGYSSRIGKEARGTQIMRAAACLKGHAVWRSGCLWNPSPVMQSNGFDVTINKSILNAMSTGQLIDRIHGSGDVGFWQAMALKRILSKADGLTPCWLKCSGWARWHSNLYPIADWWSRPSKHPGRIWITPYFELGMRSQNRSQLLVLPLHCHKEVGYEVFSTFWSIHTPQCKFTLRTLWWGIRRYHWCFSWMKG